MGEQGAKSLRGGKMEDVIFAGSTGRAPLGRAEVLLTIDNSDGALPIDYAEVTISRTMFRNGGSEYAINGTTSRLLDIQELLSDSGIGREMHVIVGQGQLRDILLATPEQRRGYIEEAAGVLKHRKRKEKAIRKLEAMEVNLTRVEDLTNELRRQLKPLGRQAEVARRANVIQSDVRDSRLRILADDLTQMKSALEAEIADETALRERRSEVESELTAAKAREAILDAAIAESAPQVDRAQNTFYALGAQQERLRSTMALAKERVRLGETEEEEVSRGRDPEEIDREAHALRVQESELAGQVDADRLALNAAISERTSAEAALAAEDARLHAATRAVADRREGLARIAGQVAAAKSRLDARSAEIERLDERLAEARDRADQAAQEFTALETQVAGMDAGELGLDSEHDESSRALADAEKELESAKLEEQEAERERAGAIARLEALEQGMARRDGGAAILAATDTMSGILGSVAALMQIENGWESAIAAALGSAADAIAVSSTDAAENAVRMLRRDDAGRAALVVVGQNSSDQSQWPTLPGSQRYAVDLISCDAELRSSLSGILQRVVVTNSLEEARQVVTSNQSLRAVTRDGDLVGHGFVQGGSQGTQSLVEIQAAIDEARLKLEASAHRVDRAKFAVVGATQAQEAALVLVSNSLERLHESDASMAAIAVQLGSLQSVVRSATGEADRVAAAIASANKAREDDLRSVQELEARYAAAENDQISDSELSEESRESLVKTLEDVRQAELNVRLTVRTGEERVRAGNPGGTT